MTESKLQRLQLEKTRKDLEFRGDRGQCQRHGAIAKGLVKSDGKSFRKYSVNSQYKGGTWVKKHH